MKHAIWLLLFLACNFEPDSGQHAAPLDTTPTASTPQSAQVGGIEYRYDDLGRVVGKGDLELTYGPDGHLATARRGQDVWSYAYDEKGNRILKKKNGRPVAAFLDGTYIIEDKIFTPVHVQGRLIGVLEGGQFHLLGVDPRGTVITDRDGTPRPASPYGVRATRPDISEALDYIEKGYDPVLGTVRMGVRDYDPYLGQFWTPDPLYFEQPERCISDPVSCNLYSYARNNPISNIDPDGTSPVHGAFIGAGVGGGGELLFQTYRWIRYDEPFQWSAVGAAAAEGALWGSGGQYLTFARGIAPWRMAAGGASLGAGAGTAGRALRGEDTTPSDVTVDASLGVLGAGVAGRLSTGVERAGSNRVFIGPQLEGPAHASTVGATESGWVRVSRWMSAEEAAIWRGRSAMPQPLGDRTQVTSFGLPRPGAASNQVRVDFEVPSYALETGGNAGWWNVFNKGRAIPIREVTIVRQQ